MIDWSLVMSALAAAAVLIKSASDYRTSLANADAASEQARAAGLDIQSKSAGDALKIMMDVLIVVRAELKIEREQREVLEVQYAELKAELEDMRKQRDELTVELEIKDRRIARLEEEAQLSKDHICRLEARLEVEERKE